MADYGQLMTRSAKAAVDMRTKQYHFLRASAAGVVNVASEAAGGANDLVGVLQNKPNINGAAAIAFFGETKVIAGGAITADTYITTTESGRAATAVSNDMVAGIALQTSGNDGEIIRALIFPPVPLMRT